MNLGKKIIKLYLYYEYMYILKAIPLCNMPLTIDNGTMSKWQCKQQLSWVHEWRNDWLNEWQLYLVMAKWIFKQIGYFEWLEVKRQTELAFNHVIS